MKPPYKSMSLPMKLVLWFVVANAFLAALSLIFSPTNTDSTFFWPITPPINAGMFGALYLAAGGVVLQAVLRGRWELARYLTAMIPVFTGMMLLTTLLHADRFVPGGKLWYWSAVYIVAPLAAIIFYLQHERRKANWQIVSKPVTPTVRIVAVTVGTLTALGALVSYAFPTLLTAGWPWPMSPLMLRVFLSWATASAVSLLWFAVDRDWERVQPVATLMIAAAALMLVMLFSHRGDLKPDGIGLWLVGGGIVGIGLLGGFMHWAQRT